MRSEGEPAYLQREKEGKQERPLGHCPVGGQRREKRRNTGACKQRPASRQVRGQTKKEQERREGARRRGDGLKQTHLWGRMTTSFQNKRLSTDNISSFFSFVNIYRNSRFILAVKKNKKEKK